MKTLQTVPAHFDGKEIKLDVPILLEPNARLLITILDSAEDDDQALVYAAMSTSEKAFAQIWDNDEDAIYDNL
ncbi:MAG: hypothetical protein GY805_26130 [Chloroflexi bacterium]|nr:hypothetical protein [Chloroflexota bacterium]